MIHNTLPIVNCQLSIINYNPSIVNYQLPGWIWIICVILVLSACKTSQPAASTKPSIAAISARQHRDLEAILPVGAIVEPVNYGDALKVIINSKQLFLPNSNTLTPNANNMLRKLAEHLKKYRASTVRINGFTDNSGNVNYNQILTERRAQRVYDYLCEQGVVPSRMYFEGKGMREPVASNNSAEGRELNRRIEIMIYGIATSTR
ncbi:MAG: OmpA family protein [Tannerella sp.]|jgi:outer membrane protein OmpA-like peptidoglycan-associated protein|nr:OmpA family protein [Tannerella sp.]